jgi:hypothetical protein
VSVGSEAGTRRPARVGSPAISRCADARVRPGGSQAGIHLTIRSREDLRSFFLELAHIERRNLQGRSRSFPPELVLEAWFLEEEKGGTGTRRVLGGGHPSVGVDSPAI